MEMKFSPYNSSNMKRDSKENKQSQAHGESTEAPHHHHHEEEDESNSLNLRNLSKLILPPLGVSSFNQNQTKSKWIISPMDSRYRCWETFMVLLVAYSAWVYPFEVAFLNSTPNKKLYIADNIVDLFFAIDIVLTFFVAYINPRTQLLVRHSKKIAVSMQQHDDSSNQFENCKGQQQVQEGLKDIGGIYLSVDLSILVSTKRIRNSKSVSSKKHAMRTRNDRSKDEEDHFEERVNTGRLADS